MGVRMKHLYRYAYLGVATLLVGCNGDKLTQVVAERATPQPQWAAPFDSLGYSPDSCAFLLYVPATDSAWVFNPAVAVQRTPPGAVFNTELVLLGLEKKAIKGANMVLDVGTVSSRTRVSLKDAYQSASVDFFVEVSNTVGRSYAKKHLGQWGYPVAHFTPATEAYWQDGGLEVNLFDEVSFLANALEGRLPLKPRTLNVLRYVAREDSTASYRLYGKSGWPIVGNRAGTLPVNVGWWVGWVERPAAAPGQPERAYFALRIFQQRLVRKGWANERLALVKELLAQAGWLPPQVPLRTQFAHVLGETPKEQ